MCLRFIFFILVTQFIPQCPSKRVERWKQQATIFYNISSSNIIHNVRKLLRQETQDSAFSEETPRSKVRGNLSRHEHLCLCYCCFGPCLLLLFEAVYVILVLGPVSYCWFWSLLVLLFWSVFVFVVGGHVCYCCSPSLRRSQGPRYTVSGQRDLCENILCRQETGDSEMPESPIHKSKHCRLQLPE